MPGGVAGAQPRMAAPYADWAETCNRRTTLTSARVVNFSNTALANAQTTTQFIYTVESGNSNHTPPVLSMYLFNVRAARAHLGAIS